MYPTSYYMTLLGRLSRSDQSVDVSVCIPCIGSRDGSMGLWEVTEDVMSQAKHGQSDESVPSYAHISHRALKDIPKEYTNPYNCKVRALAFNNNQKVRLILTRQLGMGLLCQ